MKKQTKRNEWYLIFNIVQHMLDFLRSNKMNKKVEIADKVMRSCGLWGGNSTLSEGKE